ncbi:nucleotide exchange factor GrpE [Undibacterium sp. TJN19]|uniref:nucleotide exchange factor GrpE n=1 Tax=Undibacterium sp. TJN19 TaxID=3413055 RepID=UPI003BF1AC2C
MQEQESQQTEKVEAAETSAPEPLQENVAQPETDAKEVNQATPASAQPDASQIIAQLEAKVQELQDSFMRAKAEGENIRRRAQEDITKAHKFAIEGFAEAMVPVKDSLEMALKIDTPSIEALKEGVEMTLKQLSAAFDKNRLTDINPAPGEKLDPMKHQAISMVPAEQDANTVVTVLQKGYTIADRLLRPALVTVAQGK